jgi:hypothetical protein
MTTFQQNIIDFIRANGEKPVIGENQLNLFD